MARESFSQIVERKKKEGYHRELATKEMFGGQEGLERFQKDMKQVHQDYLNRSRRSLLRLCGVFLD